MMVSSKRILGTFLVVLVHMTNSLIVNDMVVPTLPTTVAHAKPVSDNQPVESCSEPLGMMSGKIGIDQIRGGSLYDQKQSFSNARLNKTSYPPGFLSADNSCPITELSYLHVIFSQKTVVTGIATQGYGDPKMASWVKAFSLIGSTNGDDYFTYQPFKLKGNSDPNTIVFNRIKEPKEVKSIFIIPNECNGKRTGLRVEFYGCVIKKTYILWVRRAKERFHEQLFETKSIKFEKLEKDIKTKLPGEMSRFLFVNVHGYSPGSVIIQLEVGAVEAEAQSLLETAKIVLQNESLGLDPNYFYIQDPKGNRDCKPPTITLNLSSNLKKPSVIKMSESFTVTSQIVQDCKFNETLEWKWSMSRLPEGGEYFENRTFYSSKEAPKYKLELLKHSLKYGTYYIEQRVGQHNSTLFSHQFGFLKVLRTPLEGFINGPPIVAKGYNDLITVDVSASYDPDELPPSTKGMTFEWSCVRITKATSQSPIGCFGTSSTALGKQKGPILKLPVDKLRPDNEYNITVVVKKDKRQRTLSHVVKVDQVATIDVKIKCTQNCGEYNAEDAIVLEAECLGIICQEKPQYTWRVIEKHVTNGNESWNVVDIPFIVVNPKFNLSRITIPKGKLKVGVKYMLDVNATSKTGFAVSNITLNSNEAPIGGTCYVEPKVGEAFTTVFNFTCEGWTDEEPPLTYKFHYLSLSKVEVLLQFGKSYRVSTKLPVGDANNDYEIPINIFIADSANVGRNIQIKVKSKPWLKPDTPSTPTNKVNSTVVENSTLYRYTVGEGSRLSVLLSNNDIKQATNLANEVLSMLSSNSVLNMTSEDKIKIKDNMISKMSQVKVTDIKKLIQVSSVVAGATEERTELSEQSKGTSVKMLESMADVFSKLPANDKKLSGMVTEASTNLIHGMGNVLDTFAHTAAEDTDSEDKVSSNKTATKESKEQSKEAVHKVLSLIDKVSDTLLSTKTAGDSAVKVKTKKIEMVLQRSDPSSLGEGLSGDGGGVKFPGSAPLLRGNSTNQSHIDTQMLVLKNNPYTWDKSAKSVKSAVLSVDLKGSSGQKLQVEGLEEEIELIINSDSQPPPVTVESFSKPSKNGSMRYHTTNITGTDKTMQITITPEDGKYLEVFIGYTTRPTIQKHAFKALVPDMSKCSNSTLDCPEQFIIIVPANVTTEEGRYFIGIKKPDTENSPVKSRRRRSCSESSGGRQKRSVVCVEFKDPPTTPPPTPLTKIPAYDPTTDVNYTISIAIKACLYWSETKQIWTNYGCRVSSKTINGSLVCLCNHLSSFGGDFFVAPNPIDFDQVWLAMKSIGQTKNFVVLSTLCTIFAIYLIAVIFARREDKNDALKVTRSIPVSQMSDTSHCYEITVYTGIWRRCGTTSNIAMKLCGEDGESGTVSLSYSAMCDKQVFGRGSINIFIFAADNSLGDLNHIRVWHDNSGDHPAWFLRQVVVRDMQADTKWFFVCNKWLALEKGDGRIDRILYVSTEKEINGFRNKFCSRAAAGLGDGHLWLSVVTRPPASPFTRVQRVTCCLCVLLTAMVTNAMFYQFGEESKDSFKLGPLVLSVKQIIIGIQSSFMVVPINLLIVFFFKNAKPKDETDLQRQRANSSAEEKKKKSGLPHFFFYVAWFLAISASLASAAVTFFYSMMWGRETSNQWLTSILVSFSQDIILIQPIKVLIVATLLAFIIKKAPEEDSDKEISSQGKSVTKTSKVYSKVAGEVKEPQSPKNEDMETFRQYRIRVLKMARTLIELFFYLTFVWMLMVICYGSRDVGRYWMTHGVKDMLIKFDKVINADSYWHWARTYMIPGLYSSNWYNGQPFEYKEGFVSNKAGYLVGMPRLRQVRAVTDDCPIKYLYSNFTSTLNPCIPPYSFKAESKTLYNMPGWFPLTNNDTRFYNQYELLKMCPRPWRYRTATELDNLPFQGSNNLYSGGGYVADLGYNDRSAYRVLKNLEENSWIDEKTRAVFLEVLIFEPSSSFFSAVTYLFEKTSMGGAFTYVSVKTMSLYGARSHGLQSLYAICELTIILIVIYFVIAELVKFYRQRCSYFKQTWNWVEITQILASIATVVLSIFRRYHATKLVDKVHTNPFMTSSFHYVVMWSEIENSLMAILIFVITMKLLRILKFNQHINVLARSMSKCGKKLVSYSAVFLVAFLAFAQVAILAFGPSVPAYSSVVNVFRTQFSMFVGGDADYQELKNVNKILGPLYFFAFMTAMATILINMFLAILNEAYREVHVFRSIEAEEHKMMTVFMDYANRRIRKGFSSLKDAKLFPESSKYEVNEHLLRSEEEKEQKYTPLDEPVKTEKRLEDETEDKMLASVKGCFQNLRYELRHLLSTRKRTYKVHKVNKKNQRKGQSEIDQCQCQGMKYHFKGLSTSFHNITDELFKNNSSKPDRQRLLPDHQKESFDNNEETDLVFSDSEGELFLENSLFFGQDQKKDRETNI